MTIKDLELILTNKYPDLVKSLIKIYLDISIKG